MATISCPKCDSLMQRAGFAPWQIIVAIVFFPIGLCALLLGRQPTRCGRCGFRLLT